MLRARFASKKRIVMLFHYGYTRQLIRFNYEKSPKNSAENMREIVFRLLSYRDDELIVESYYKLYSQHRLASITVGSQCFLNILDSHISK